MCACISLFLVRWQVYLQTFISSSNLLSCMLVGMSTGTDFIPNKLGAKGKVISSQRVIHYFG